MRFHFFVLVVFLSSPPAWSQTPRGNDADAEATARLQAGLALANQGKWEEARLSFVQAYAVLPKIDLLWNLAFSELKSGHCRDALAHFKAYEHDPKADQAKISALPKLRERAYQQIGRAKVQAPSNALVWMDGAQTVWTDPIELEPGSHTIVVKLGERTHERSFTVAAGQLLEMPFSFPEQTASAPVAAASAAGQAAPPAPERSAQASAKYWWVGGLGAAATITVVAGVGFTLAAKSDRAKVDEFKSRLGTMACGTNPECSELRDVANSQVTHAHLANGFLVGSAILASAGVVTWLAWPKRSDVAVFASPTQIMFSARF
jgi:tetratricopeptide (TPR) repeat protein